MSRARVAVVGAGAIGGYYGLRLLRAGEDVLFIARGAHLDALRARGLTLRSPAGETTTPVVAAGDTDQAGPVDLVLFCVKAHDTQAAAALLPPLLGPRSVVLTLQNGLDNVDEIAAAIGPGRILIGTLYVATQLAEAGVILHTGGEGKIVLGEPEGGMSERVLHLAGLLERAGIPNEASAEMPRVVWEKFMFITGIGSVTALAGAGVGQLLADPEGRTLLAASCAEVAAVAKAEGAPLAGDPVAQTLALAAAQAAGWRSSLARDLEAGRRLEVDALSGAVLRRGRRHHIAVPVHQTIYACLSMHQPSG